MLNARIFVVPKVCTIRGVDDVEGWNHQSVLNLFQANDGSDQPGRLEQ